jgi:type-F conjugative transfer system pilin assembly protein TrbC
MILLTLLGATSYAGELEDLIKSQDAIVKQHMPKLQDFIIHANQSGSRYQLAAENIIKNSKANYNKATKFDWLHDLSLPEQQSSSLESELYVFVSLSMPKTRLIELIKEAIKYNGLVVLRGLKNNNYTDTALFLQPIIQQAGAGFIIDPKLFAEYNITKVPMFILNDPSIKKHDKIAGNINLQYALQEFVKNGDLKKIARSILEGRK